jgi:hypothetical protein
MLRFLGRFAVFFCSKVPKMNGNAPFLSRFFRLNKGLKVGGDAPIFPRICSSRYNFSNMLIGK